MGWRAEARWASGRRNRLSQSTVVPERRRAGAAIKRIFPEADYVELRINGSAEHFEGPQGGGVAAFDAEFFIDVFQMFFDGAAADLEDDAGFIV